MSLVIASNYQDEYSGQLEQDRAHKVNAGTPMQKSSFFSNHLKNPMIIPPNSEVAVQSVKINRLPVFDVHAGNRFHLYWGMAIEDKDGTPLYEMDDTFSTPIPCTIAPGTYTQDQFRAELQKELNRALGHPTWFDKVVITDAKSTAGVWEGFDIDFQCHAKAPVTDYGENMTDWVNYRPETETGPVAGEYSVSHNAGAHTTTLKRLKATATHPAGSLECSLVCRNAPMDLTSGSMEIDLFDKFGKSLNDPDASPPAANPPTGVAYRRNACSFSLSRERKLAGTSEPDPTNPFLSTAPGGPPRDGYGFANDVVCYGDYRIDWNEKLASHSGAPTYALVLSQAVWDDGANGVVMRTIEYWKGLPGGDDGGANPVTSEITEADLVDDTTNPDVNGFVGKFKIEFKGSGIKLWMIHYTKATGEVYKVICDTTAVANRVNHEHVWAPINQNKWALYMGWSAKTLDHDSVFGHTRWNDALRAGDWTYGTASVPGSSWWGQALMDKQGGGSANSLLQLAQLVESRPNNQALAGSTINWQDLSADADCPAMSKALVLNAPKTTIDTGKGIYQPARGANMGAQLGFPGWHAVASVQLGTNKNFADAAKTDPTAKWEIKSVLIPEYSVHDAFIKVPSLTCQSYNFCKSIPSQILYHIPRWSDNRQYGCLFHEATEKTYIALRNPDAIQCNQLDFQIVDKNEQIVRDLTGDTTIVLHIRPR